jgi:CRISPR type I-E-associated protein CasB/Cse2
VTDTATAPPASEHSALIGSLAARLTRHDTASMSTLRRCLGPLPRTPDNRLWPLVIPYVGDNDNARDAGALTACLWATWHTGYNGPVHGKANLGGALRRALPYDKHQATYNNLAYASWGNLSRQLTPLVSSCANARQALDWDQFQRDIRAWRNGDKDRVLRRWANALFNPSTITISAPTAKENS